MGGPNHQPSYGARAIKPTTIPPLLTIQRVYKNCQVVTKDWIHPIFGIWLFCDILGLIVCLIFLDYGYFKNIVERYY